MFDERILLCRKSYEPYLNYRVKFSGKKNEKHLLANEKSAQKRITANLHESIITRHDDDVDDSVLFKGSFL